MHCTLTEKFSPKTDWKPLRNFGWRGGMRKRRSQNFGNYYKTNKVFTKNLDFSTKFKNGSLFLPFSLEAASRQGFSGSLWFAAVIRFEHHDPPNNFHQTSNLTRLLTWFRFTDFWPARFLWLDGNRTHKCGKIRGEGTNLLLSHLFFGWQAAVNRNRYPVTGVRDLQNCNSQCTHCQQTVCWMARGLFDDRV